MSFTKQLYDWTNKTEEKILKVKRMSCFDLFSAVIMSTPVDKGVLRNNWFIDFGPGGSKETTSEADKGGQHTINRIELALKDLTMPIDVVLTNNLPYAVPIEFDGLSGKAKRGMLRKNAMRWETIVTNNIKKVANE